MSPLTLRLRAPPVPHLDLAAFTPDRLAGLSPDAIRRLPLWVGNRASAVGDLFDVGGADSETLVIQSESDRLDWIGAGMTRGRVLVEGRAGAYLGRGLRGGLIEVTGDAGPFAGSRQSGGTLRIRGNAGDFLGAAVPGERRGLCGGRLEVWGSAGDRVGDHQRRGSILIAGDVGDYCASRMVAGTILVLGRTGAWTGFGMRRGTLLLGEAPALPPTFNHSGTWDLGFLSLLIRDLASAGGPFAALAGRGTRVRRWVGDLAADGRGEVLVWTQTVVPGD